jgi:hypothetical protein
MPPGGGGARDPWTRVSQVTVAKLEIIEVHERTVGKRGSDEA